MKTIRQNTFETNSSSTHAYTLQTVKLDNKPDLNFLPDSDGIVKLSIRDADASNDPRSKASLLLSFLAVCGLGELYHKALNTISEFSGYTVQVSDYRYNQDSGKWDVCDVVIEEPYSPDEEEDDEWDNPIAENFGDYLYEYGDTVSSFYDKMKEIAEDPEKTKIFVFCSKQGFSIDTYYS